MQFARLVELVNVTPTAKLCEAWEVSAEYVDARKQQQTPLTLREAGSVAQINGLLLEDVLSV